MLHDVLSAVSGVEEGVASSDPQEKGRAAVGTAAAWERTPAARLSLLHAIFLAFSIDEWGEEAAPPLLLQEILKEDEPALQ